jgi:hypothetical protein
MSNPDHFSASLETIFGLKYLNSFLCIRNGKNSDQGKQKRNTVQKRQTVKRSGINKETNCPKETNCEEIK